MKKLSVILFFLIYSFSANGQEELQKAIVLINGTAHLVDVSRNGDIVEIYQSIENYFTTQESHKSILTRLSKDPNASGKEIVLFEQEREPVPTFKNENTKPVEVGNDQYIEFSPGRALLRKLGVDQVRRITKNYQSGSIRKIDIVSYHDGTFRSKALARNRASAIQDLMIAFGVSKSDIGKSNTQGSKDTKLDYLRVSFRK